MSARTPRHVTPEAPVDARYDALSRSFDRLVDWQGHVVEITNDLLVADSDTVDAAINLALLRTGKLADSDRTYVFRLRDPNRLDNTHEWVADGIEPVIEQLQDLPDDVMSEWRADLTAGRPVYIPDIAALPDTSVVRDILLAQQIKSLLAVPMHRSGQLKGFVGYDAVRDHRHFLPAEIQLIQSVANAINALMERSAAEIAAHEARDCLEKESNRLRATLRAIPDLLLELDGEGRFVNYNAGTLTKPFMPPEGFIGKLLEDVFDSTLAALAREVMADVDRDGQSSGREYQIDLDGVPNWFQVSASSKAQGPHKSYVFLVRNITESRVQQRQILRLSKVAELTSNLVVVTDLQDRIEWVNPAFERRSGWALNDVVGQKPKNFLQVSAIDGDARRRIGAAIRNGKAFQGELLNKSRHGEEYWTSVDITALHDETGDLSGFVAVQADITNLKRAHERAIQDLAVAIDETSDAVFLTTPGGLLKYANASAQRLFGVSATEGVEPADWKIFFPDPDFQQALASSHYISGGAWHGETTGRHRDGREARLEVSLTRRDDGSVIAISRDITERRRQEMERSHLREELQIAQRKETIAHLAAGVAHDLNNMIAVVDGTANILEEQVDGGSEIAACVDRIRRATQTARDLVSNLGRLDRSHARRSQHDLRALIRQAADLLGTRRRVEHNVILKAPDVFCPVWGSVTEIHQVITNLAINACDAKADRPNCITISVLAPPDAAPAHAPDVGDYRSDLDYSLFVISDTGTGVSEANRKRLFERYFTTKGEQGTGLGMPIVASILRDNDAALWFETELGKGTTVTIAWPSAAPPPTAREMVRSKRSSETDDLSKHRILIVDDLPDVADVLASMVRATGAQVLTSSNPAQALRCITDASEPLSVLITDLDMPGISGIDLAHAAARRDPPLPVILVTALPERAGRHKDLFCAIAPKPVDRFHLAESIHGALVK